MTCGKGFHRNFAMTWECSPLQIFLGKGLRFALLLIIFLHSRLFKNVISQRAAGNTKVTIVFINRLGDNR